MDSKHTDNKRFHTVLYNTHTGTSMRKERTAVPDKQRVTLRIHWLKVQHAREFKRMLVFLLVCLRLQSKGDGLTVCSQALHPTVSKPLPRLSLFVSPSCGFVRFIYLFFSKRGSREFFNTNNWCFFPYPSQSSPLPFVAPLPCLPNQPWPLN